MLKSTIEDVQAALVTQTANLLPDTVKDESIWHWSRKAASFEKGTEPIAK
jgi:ABC-type iron transport system FetAB ATPase subunit